jgi:hypothetical protein
MKSEQLKQSVLDRCQRHPRIKKQIAIEGSVEQRAYLALCKRCPETIQAHNSPEQLWSAACAEIRVQDNNY